MYPLFRQIDDIYRAFLSCTTIYSHDKKTLLTKYSHCVRIVSAREGQPFPTNGKGEKSDETGVTPNAPAAIGPYSQGIAAGQTVYVSGQLPIDPATGLIPEGIAAQTAQSLKNIQAILAQQEMTLANVVKTTVFLADINDFAEMNKVYGEYFAQPYPARSAVQVGKLPKDAPLEIECIAVK